MLCNTCPLHHSSVFWYWKLSYWNGCGKREWWQDTRWGIKLPQEANRAAEGPLLGFLASIAFGTSYTDKRLHSGGKSSPSSPPCQSKVFSLEQYCCQYKLWINTFLLQFIGLKTMFILLRFKVFSNFPCNFFLGLLIKSILLNFYR